MRKPNLFAVAGIVILIAVLIVFLVVSGKDELNDECEIVAESSSILVDETTTVTFQTDDYSYTAHEGLTWTSDDEEIATVSESGVVTGISAGTTEITGTYDGDTGSVSITVENTESVENDYTSNLDAKTTALQDPPTVSNPAYSAKQSGSDKVFFDSTTGHAYALFNYDDLGLSTFNEWEAFCENMGGHLAIIDNESENSFLYNSLRGTYNSATGEQMYSAFFGYTDQENEGSWHWLYKSGDYTPNWADGQPNDLGGGEDYALFHKDTMDGTWNDSKIGVNSYWFICEWES